MTLLEGPVEAAGLGSRVVVPNLIFRAAISTASRDGIFVGPGFKSMTNLPQALGNASEPSGNAGSAAFWIPAL